MAGIRRQHLVKLALLLRRPVHRHLVFFSDTSKQGAQRAYRQRLRETPAHPVGRDNLLLATVQLNDLVLRAAGGEGVVDSARVAARGLNDGRRKTLKP